MATSISNSSSLLNCSTNSVASIPIRTGPWCGIAAQIGSKNVAINATYALQTCCHDAPIISLIGSCDLYCNALNQTTDQLMGCLIRNFGAEEKNTAGVLCSRKGSNDGFKNVTPPCITTVISLAAMLSGLAFFFAPGL